jgi:hypothetical protein
LESAPKRELDLLKRLFVKPGDAVVSHGRRVRLVEQQALNDLIIVNCIYVATPPQGYFRMSTHEPNVQILWRDDDNRRRDLSWRGLSTRGSEGSR